MWIKWKYNDHGRPDFRELEIPDDFGGYENVEDYLCQRSDLNIPTWSERFMVGRVKWEKLDLSEKEIRARKIKELDSKIKYHEKMYKACLLELKELL